MEMTKNKMIDAQLIAMIFCLLLGPRAGGRVVRKRLQPSSANPESARHSQTRLSASSIVKGYGMHSAGRVQQAAHGRLAIELGAGRKSGARLDRRGSRRRLGRRSGGGRRRRGVGETRIVDLRIDLDLLRDEGLLEIGAGTAGFDLESVFQPVDIAVV